MKLHIFMINSDEDYGALTFEQSGIPIEEVFRRMKKGDGLHYTHKDDEDGQWNVTLEASFDIRDSAEANHVLSAINLVTEIIGDYDHMKHVNYAHILEP